MLPAHLTKGVAGTLTLDLLSHPTTVTVLVEKSDGTDVSSGSATVSAVTTTLSSAASVGARTITVASATGITTRMKLWLEDVAEAVQVKSIASTTLTLFAPLAYDHASSAAVKCNRASYAVSASALTETWWDGRVTWTVDGEVIFSSAECTLYPLKRLATLNDLLSVDDELIDRLADAADIEGTLDAAHDDVLSKVGSVDRARVFTGAPEFRRAVALRWMVNFWRSKDGDEADRMYNRYKSEYIEALAEVTLTTPRDRNQDGVIGAYERLSLRSVPIGRG